MSVEQNAVASARKAGSSNEPDSSGFRAGRICQRFRDRVKDERIPQPEGWGASNAAYWKRSSAAAQSPNRKVGDLSSRCVSQCLRLTVKDPQPSGWGICEIAVAALVGWTGSIPNLPVGVFTQSP